MLPPPHPILKPYITASHTAAEKSYAAGHGLRSKASHTSTGGVRRAKKMRAAYISRLRRAAYIKMLESACERADREMDQIVAALEAAQKEKQTLLGGIKAHADEMNERSAMERGEFGAEAVAVDFGAAEVFAAEVAETRTGEGSETTNTGTRTFNPVFGYVDDEVGLSLRSSPSTLEHLHVFD